jgi:acetyltransferase-like isoleucine patch superfamily enzyme
VSEQSYFEEAARMHATLKQLMPDTYAMNHNAHLINHIHPSAVIEVDELTLGVGVTIEEGVRIKAKTLRIDDFVYIGRNTTIRAPSVSIGDYTRINEISYCGGRKPLHIGRNCYLGRGVYLDSNGGLTLEDNVGVGAISQLWSHMEHGDRIFGLRDRWHTERELVVRKDAWLAARVVVSNTREIGERALILNESNLLCDIPADTTWAGNPAKDVTDKLGPQFEAINDYEKYNRLLMEFDLFEESHPEHARWLVAVTPGGDVWSRYEMRADATFFDVVHRTYTKRRTAAEVAFMRFTSGKFTPVGEA